MHSVKFKLGLFILATFSLVGCENKQDPVSIETPQLEMKTVLQREPNEALSVEYAEQRKEQISNVDYTLDFDLSKQGDLFDGKTLVEFNLNTNINAPITLDFDSGKVKSVKVNQKLVVVDYTKWFIEIPIEHFKGGRNQIEISYTRAYSKDGSGLHKFTDPEDGSVYLYTELEPYDANKVFPHFDQPNLKASYKLTVKTSKSWQVIANMREDNIENHDDFQTWDFPKSMRFSTYIFALHAGNYIKWEDKAGDVPLRLFARKSLAQYVKTEDWFVPTQKAFKFFNGYFEIDYPFHKYDQIIVPDYNSGAMENVAAVTFNESYVSRGVKSISSRRGLANTIAHELAHMWFGDLVTMNWWDGLWLNESFATFMANLALDKTGQFENVWQNYYSGTKQWAYSTDDSVTTHPIQLPVANTTEAFSNFDGITYGKGGSVLKQLWYYLGEENFRKGVSHYLKKYAYQNTELDDFISSLEQVSGFDLEQWTQQWLYQSGLNSLEANYQCKDNLIESFSLIQKAPKYNDTLRSQKVKVALFSSNDNILKLEHTEEVVYSGAETNITQLKGLACPSLVYPNQEDYGYVKVLLDPKSRLTLLNSINSIEHTYARLMMWQSLIDGVNDAKYPLNEFIDFAVKNLAEETDDTIVRKVSGSLNAATSTLFSIKRSGKPTQKYFDKIERFMWTMLRQSKPNSEQQKQWYRMYISNVFSDKHFIKIQNILDGILNIDGIDIDQDKRWTIVNRLNWRAFGDYEKRLDSEKLRDQSDSGLLNAIGTEAIRPNAATKKKWFDIIQNHSKNLKLVEKEEIMYSLFPGTQYKLQRPYLEEIFKTVPVLNKDADLRYLTSYVDAFIPTECTKESVKRLEGLLREYQTLKFPVVRALKNMHEYDERCVKKVELYNAH